jgi:transcriptional regulator with XRE-family HTH domain
MEEQQKREMGARIAELRDASGYGQQHIADYCDVRLRTYQLWQAGDSVPNQEHLEKLARLFGVTTKYILRGETPDPFTGAQEEAVATLAQVAEQVNELHALLLGTDEGPLAGLAARLLRAAGLPPPQADAPPATPPATLRRKTA